MLIRLLRLAIDDSSVLTFYIGKPVYALHMWYHIEGDIGDERNLPEARCRDIKVGNH